VQNLFLGAVGVEAMTDGQAAPIGGSVRASTMDGDYTK
jgi:hypothetical protein